MNNAAIPTGKNLALLFFTRKKRNDAGWECLSCEKVVKQRPCGYTNLCTHINQHHKNEIQSVCNRAKKRKLSAFESITYNKRTLAVHGWLECVTICLRPFSFCENVVIRRHFRHESISRGSLINYMHRLTKIVERKIEGLLPDRLAIVFDGWAGGDTHFVSVFATFPANNKQGYDRVFLACSPMENEECLDANEHYNFLVYVLGVFGKSIDAVVAVVGDNCSMNRAMSRK